jgi:gas vesicle protein
MSEQNNGSETGVFLAGFILGGLVGAAVAMILAPSSGQETRKQLTDRGLELRGRAEEKIEEARKRAEQAAEEARKRAEQAAEEARKRAEELQERGRVVLEEQKSRITSAVSQPGKETGDEAADTSPNGGQATG